MSEKKNIIIAVSLLALNVLLWAFGACGGLLLSFDCVCVCVCVCVCPAINPQIVVPVWYMGRACPVPS